MSMTSFLRYPFVGGVSPTDPSPRSPSHGPSRAREWVSVPNLTLEMIQALKHFLPLWQAGLAPVLMASLHISGVALCVLQIPSSQDFLGAHRFFPVDKNAHSHLSIGHPCYWLCLLEPRDGRIELTRASKQPGQSQQVVFPEPASGLGHLSVGCIFRGILFLSGYCSSFKTH